MVKYYCNKCGCEIHTKMLRVQTKDESGNQTNYHLCNTHTMQFIAFMSRTDVVECDGQLDVKASAEDKSISPNCTDLNALIESANKNRDVGSVSSDNGSKGSGETRPINLGKLFNDACKKLEKQTRAEGNTGRTVGVTAVDTETDCAGAKPKRRKQQYITPDAKEFINSHRDIMSAADIAKHLDIPYQSVYYYLKNSKGQQGEFNAKSTDEVSQADAGRCVALHRAGWSIKDIADELSKEETDVKEVLLINGVTLGGLL